MIVGGSIAGCAAAVALERLGAEVELVERSSGVLRDRGSGIAIPIPLRDELVEKGYLDTDYAHCRAEGRWWVLADGSAAGRVLWEQPGTAALNNWGVLWRSLRSRVPDDRYRDGTELVDFDAHGDGVRVELSDGTSRTVDVLVGADGYRSKIRRRLVPDAHLDYAGYILWRGNYPEARLEKRAAIDRGDEARTWHTVCFDGGHGVIYMIPGFDDRADVGHRRVNWAVYAPQPDGMDFDEPTSVAPGDVSADDYRALDRLLTDAFPPDYEAVIRATPVGEVSIQPIYDEVIDAYVQGPVMLIGDAGTVSRPHTGSGATKALQDALALERLGAAHTDWSDLLAAYDEERTAAGTDLVELGRRIGRDQVTHTPPWGSMGPDDFDAWTRGTLAGESLYFYGNAEDG